MAMSFRKIHLVTLVWIFQLTSVVVECTGQQAKTNNTGLYEHLSRNYDRHTVPFNSNGDGPLLINMATIVESFDSIEETTMEFSLYVYLVQKWRDPRLSNLVNTMAVMAGKDIDFIWKPDTYCLNARQSDLMMPDEQSHSMVRLNKSGDIVYSRGAYLKASCMMDLRDFPMDNQKCSIKFASYGYSTKYAVYEWDKRIPLTIPDSLKELAQFVLVDSSVSTHESPYYSGNFTILTVTFHFERRLGYYLLQIYVPCTFLVMLSWIAFWMDKRDTGNRLTVGVTTILTIMFLLGYSNSSVPKMSYVKAMDVYLLSAFAFIFSSLIETVLCWRFDNGPVEDTEKGPVNAPLNDVATNNDDNQQRTNSKRAHTESFATRDSSTSELDEIMVQKIGRVLDRIQEAKVHTPLETSSKKRPRLPLDYVARIAFPVAFIMFNIIYWSVWMT